MDATRIKQKQRLKKIQNKIPQLLSKNAVLLKSELYKIGSTLPKLCLEKKWGGWWKKGKVFQQHQSILFCVVKTFFILKYKLFVLTYFFLHDTNNFENEKTKATENPCEIEHWPKQLPLLLYCPISFSLENFETSGFVPKWNKTHSEITKCFVEKNANPLTELLFANAGGPPERITRPQTSAVPTR